MFELSVAWKYLLPRRRQLSVSIISLISIFVIALVVWLIVLFFSITSGMEKHWISKLIAVTAPIRVTPTPAYYQSYYYQIDSVSLAADYAHKSIAEKRQALITDPYDPFNDEEIPETWPKPDLTPDGRLKDLVKEAFAAIESVSQVFPDLRSTDYETAFGNMRLKLIRPQKESESQSLLTQAALFGSLDPHHRALPQALLPLRNGDIANMLHLAGLSPTSPLKEEAEDEIPRSPQEILRKRLRDFFGRVTITKLMSPPSGWHIPPHLVPNQGTLKGLLVENPGHPAHILVSEQAVEDSGALPSTTVNLASEASVHLPLILAPGSLLSASLVENSLHLARKVEDLLFDVTFHLQGVLFKGRVRYHQLTVGAFEGQTKFLEEPVPPPEWVYRVNQTVRLPKASELGDGILLPKTFQDTGVLVGDRGFIAYQSTSISTIQEQRLPIFVAGFYDPGIIPIGGKYVLTAHPVTSLIRSAYDAEDSALTNGINVSFSDFREADKIKQALEQALKTAQIDRYWKVETFRQFEFTRELLQQLRSDKNLSMVIASVIIIVACSNIVSMLVILVNDKKLEIGILRSMGASARSIALIFGLCGVVMGLIGSFIGTVAALITLRHLDVLVAALGRLQGFDLFSPTFYGSTMPSEVSYEGLAFVLGATTLISLLAGLVPAVKASLLKPSAILRSE